MIMPIIDIDDLKKMDEEDHKIDEVNDIKKSIENLFKNELSDTNYRGYSLDELKDLVISSIEERKINAILLPSWNRLKIKIKKSKDAKSILSDLAEYLFS